MEDTVSRESVEKEVSRENVDPQLNGLSQAKKVSNDDTKFCKNLMLFFKN